MKTIQDAFNEVLYERARSHESEINTDEFRAAHSRYNELYQLMRNCGSKQLKSAANEFDEVVNEIISIIAEHLYKKGLIDGLQLKENGIELKEAAKTIMLKVN